MNPVAFEIFGLPIMWYGVIISMGVVAAMVVIYYLSKKKNLDYDIVIDAFLVTFPVSIVCARLYYVAFNYTEYHSFIDVINIRNGGMAIHGGVIGALVSGYIFAKYKKIDFFKYVDIIMPGVILAQGIGRWGNFVNQEAHGGKVTKEFISNFPEFIQRGMFIQGSYYHPTFLYESIWDILICIILIVLALRKREKEDSIVLAGYMILYSIGRFFIEGLRTDSLMFMGLRTAQIVSILGVILGIGLIIWIKKKNSAK
jgi:phosphatidylglycerol---prolipoprotein diacylglyceryl transferase